MPDKKTTRRTSAKPIAAKIKPTKTKKPTHKQRTGKTRIGKGLTAVLNTYKNVKRKIVPPTKTRTANKLTTTRQRAKVATSDSEYNNPTRKTGVGAMERDLNATINPITRKIDYDGATGDTVLNDLKDMEDIIFPSKRKKKKDYTLLYVLLAVVVIVLIVKSKK